MKRQHKKYFVPCRQSGTLTIRKCRSKNGTSTRIHHKIHHSPQSGIILCIFQIKMIMFLFILCFVPSLSFNIKQPYQRPFLKKDISTTTQRERGQNHIGYQNFNIELFHSSINSNQCNEKQNILIERNPSHILDKVDQILNTEMVDLKQAQEEILSNIHDTYIKDLEFCSSLGHENLSETTDQIPAFDWVYVKDNSIDSEDEPNGIPLAIRSKEPLLDMASVSIIREAAEKWWNPSSIMNIASLDGSTKSRFTYQRKGNYEAHLVDLAEHVDQRIRTIVMETLNKKMYPMVRQAFQSQILDLKELELCVYDSLVIRYNSTDAMLESEVDTKNLKFLGAGQPLHRDLGLISVNIMLNSPLEFEGGGTFFDNQLCCETLDLSMISSPPSPLKPLGVGHALAHLSNQRHAGVGTTSGVRDILVLFLMTKKPTSLDNNVETKCSGMEMAGRLRNNVLENCAKYGDLSNQYLCRMVHNRLAIQLFPFDGEAWHYLGMALNVKAKTMDSAKEAVKIMSLSISCLEHAFTLIPGDARLCNNLGLAYETIYTCTKDEKYNPWIEKYYFRSIIIHTISEMIGCDVHTDFDSVSLNYGLYVSYKNEFERAVHILNRFRGNEYGRRGMKNEEEDPVRTDGIRLLQFCESQLSRFTNNAHN